MTFSSQCIENNCIKQEIIISALNESNTSKEDINKFDTQSCSLKRFMKLMKRLDSQIICFYLKDEFNKKLIRYQKKTLAILEKTQSENHDKFLMKKSDYIIEKLKRRIFK